MLDLAAIAAPGREATREDLAGAVAPVGDGGAEHRRATLDLLIELIADLCSDVAMFRGMA
jgi:hypothetical protein